MLHPKRATKSDPPPNTPWDVADKLLCADGGWPLESTQHTQVCCSATNGPSRLHRQPSVCSSNHNQRAPCCGARLRTLAEQERHETACMSACLTAAGTCCSEALWSLKMLEDDTE
jgi:hypothetical protein